MRYALGVAAVALAGFWLYRQLAFSRVQTTLDSWKVLLADSKIPPPRRRFD
jgi:hypothetical protein